MSRRKRTRRAALLILVVGIPAVTSADAFADFAFGDFASVTGLNLGGDAAQVGSVLRVVPAAAAKVGSVWFATRQQVGGGFDTTFEFRLSNPSPACIDGSGQCGADGIVFVVQSASPTALGGAGIGMGYSGIPSSLAVEFDTWFNSSLSDPNTNHVAVLSMGTFDNETDHADAGLAVVEVPGDFNDGVIRAVRIRYVPNMLSVFIDDFANPVLSVAVDLDALLALDNGGAFVGLTAGTGGEWADHDVLSWSFTASGPGCEVPEDDSDGDGVPDCFDACPNDPNKLEPGLCGCGTPDVDSDGDGWLDCFDNCPNDFNPDQADADGNGLGDACEAAGPPACAGPGIMMMPMTLLGGGYLARRRRRRSRGRRRAPQ